MYLTNIFITLFCLFTSLVQCVPTSLIAQGPELSIKEELDQLVESRLDSNDASLYHELIEMFSDEDLLYKRDDNNDQNLQNTINYVIETLNSSGIIWDLLDTIADNPSRVDYLTNLTSSLLGGMNITINVADILNGNSPMSSLTKYVNVTAIYDAVMNSGLVTSLADGLLLDSNFRPRLADIVNRVVWSQRDLLLYIFSTVFQKREYLLKRAGVDQEDINLWSSLLRAADAEGGSTTTSSSNPSAFTIDPNIFSSLMNLNSQAAQTQSSRASSSVRATSSSSSARPTSANSKVSASASSALSVLGSAASTALTASANSSASPSSSRAAATTSSSRTSSVSSSEYSGSLGSFVENAAGAVLGSNVVGTIATDVLNSLNDTGFAVYFVKRFLSDDAYVNMTAALANSLLSSGTINIDVSGLNVTSLVDTVLGDPSTIVGAVGSLLSGNSSALSGVMSKYSGAIQSLIGDIEATGLFANLNSYIFGDSSSSASSSATQTSAASSTARREVVSASATASSSSVVEKKVETSVVASVSPTNSAVSRSSKSSNDASGVAGNVFTMKALFFTQVALLVGVFVL
ncbi:hypothetical protein KGF57_002646 [Candida theae]|uniref:GPI-anchored protein n=1 Tax=Candida theae TaxID=1198502 RepID=A0AAD5FYN2_9ASCO|nr:uncharacterized protein KGF57_002646 [Candida theae]KAI5958291.1 hypothetical protein KGF57_002646 [Candida theae]